MSNYIRITRAASSIDAWDPHDNAISREDWLALVNEDSEMKVLPVGPMPLPGAPKHGVKELGDIVLWSETGSFDEQSSVWLYYEEPGFIQMKPTVNSPDSLARKLNEIARKLNARAIGEDDEQYDDEGEVIESTLPQASKPKSWLQKLLGR
jgi:hypothetical protein